MSDLNLVLDIYWTNNPISVENTVAENQNLLIEIPLGVLLNVGGSGGSDPQLRQEFETFKAETELEQENVQNQIAEQSDNLNYQTQRIDNATNNIEFLNQIKADVTYVDQQKDILRSEINDVRNIANTNELKISTKADQVDLEAAEQLIETNRLAILTKADITALAQLALLVDTKADQAYVQQQIANLVGNAPEALNTIYELAAALQNEAGLIEALNQSVANRVRYDVATQALTEIQKQNARTNIDAEKIGTAQQLVSQITAQSIGAATTAQGNKADTALQSADVAPVALSGSFTSLSNQNKIFDVVFTALQVGVNTGILATDTLGQMLAKLQAQINAKTSLLLGETAADAYRGDRGKIAYDHSQSTGNVHNLSTGQITVETSNKWYTSARVLAEVLTGLSLTTGGVISATDSIIVALGKLQYQITNMSGGGSTNMVWVDITTVGTVPSSYVTPASIFVSKHQGTLWIKGTFAVNTTVGIDSELCRITNSAYKPYSYNVNGNPRNLAYINVATAGSTNTIKTIVCTGLGNITNSTQAGTTDVNFSLKSQFLTSDGTVNIPATPIGSLVI